MREGDIIVELRASLDERVVAEIMRLRIALAFAKINARPFRAGLSEFAWREGERARG